jgi:glucosamine--fructose-6-phosphate aminotransferase (isomerizing)
LTSRMFDEAREAPAAVARLMAADFAAYASLGEQLRADPPRSALTVARGSSDHAAHYMAYLVMARLGRLVTSLPMSLVTLYQSQLQCEGLVSWGFSQSGQSPDLIAPTRFFRAGGARTVAVVNDAGSPLAEAAQWVLPLHAGAEASVAATKSYIAQLVAGARIVAHWQNDPALLAALETLPGVLERAAYTDWSPLVDALVDADKLFVIGRGTSLAIAMEAALKFKEVCGIQAEAFSGAEVKPDGAGGSRLSAADLRTARPGPGRPARAGRGHAPPRRARARRCARGHARRGTAAGGGRP